MQVGLSGAQGHDSEKLMKERAVACGEIWSAVSASEFPVSEEERLRGGDRKIEGVSVCRDITSGRRGGDCAHAWR